MKEKINLKYEITDYSILDTHRDHAIVRAKIVNVGNNNNQTHFSKESIQKALPTLYNIPLIGIYNDLQQDFKSHAKDEREKQQTYAVGTIPESCNAHFEEYNGMEYLVADIVVWKEYFPNFYEVMAWNEEAEKQTTISMEISLNDYKKADGIFDITDFSFNGICLLGADVRPGIPNAGLRVVRFEQGKIDLEDNNLYESLLKESNEELELLAKFSEKALSNDNGKEINKKFEKGEVGNMSDEKETLAENLDEVISENTETVEPTQAEATETETQESFAEKEKAEKAEEKEDSKKEEKPEEKESCTKQEKCEEKESEEKPAEDNACEKMEETDKEDKKKEKAEKKEKVEKEEVKSEETDKPLTKSERKTYEANEKSYQEKIAYLKSELAAYMPYKGMYEQAEKEIKELLEYKEEAELNKLAQQKSEYFKTFGMAEFDDEDRDEIIKKINDYDFSYQDFKAFMADKVQKYGMKSRFQNITEIINMYAENPEVASKYAETEVESDEDKVLGKYMNV